MKRRTLLRGAGTLGALSLAGCLGNGTDATADTRDRTEFDPDARYVVRGPEGLFSAKGRWNTDLEGVVIHRYDLVTYFEEGRSQQGSAEYEYAHDGVYFRFASDQNRETFATEPEAFFPEFGGYCSLGVGNGYKDGMHPEAFSLFDGRLYFNLTPSIHAGWLRNYEARIESAERHWPDIKDSTDPIHIGPGLP